MMNIKKFLIRKKQMRDARKMHKGVKADAIVLQNNSHY